MSELAHDSSSMASFTSTNPGKNFEVLGEVPVSSRLDIATAVSSARSAFPGWRALGVSARVANMRKVLEVMVTDRVRFELAMCHEMGMPISGCRASMDWAFNHFTWSLDHAERYLAPRITHEDAKEVHKETLEPFGVTAVIVPWNFPISNFVMGAVQALVAGNTIVYKVSEEVPLFGKLVDDACKKAMLPAGVFNQVYGAGDVGALLAHSEIDALHFTGSSATGKKLYQICAQKFIPCVLELGGSDAGIIFSDADVDAQIENIFWSKFVNNGQICCGLKRLLVQEEVFDEVVEKLRASIAAKVLGLPDDEATHFGPLAAERQRKLLIEQVEDARAKGAQVIECLPVPPHLKGAYYPPTLLTNLKPNMRAWTEELFGPVLSIIPFKDEQEAIQLANATSYGLSGYVYTKDIQRYERVASAMETGSVSLNGCDYSAPFNSFGGYKGSGLGKTCGATGFAHVCRIKVTSRPK